MHGERWKRYRCVSGIPASPPETGNKKKEHPIKKIRREHELMEEQGGRVIGVGVGEELETEGLNEFFCSTSRLLGTHIIEWSIFSYSALIVMRGLLISSRRRQCTVSS
jgi:hypothetical protein